tara:strand:- start:39351 stop:39752 length:402 start_codon:yes stop_codon:yes gene_type:complete
MLIRKNKKELPARERYIVEESEVPASMKEVTHLLLSNSTHSVPAGLYKYNPVSQILTSLDDEIIGRYSKHIFANKASASSFVFYKHIPTWNKMIEDGEVIDNRTKKEDDEVPEAADTVKKVETKALVKRSLSF